MEVLDPVRLVGRKLKLRDISRALNSPGRSVFIFGERGVGKSSLALTAAQDLYERRRAILRVVCGAEDSFATVVQAIARAIQDYKGKPDAGSRQQSKPASKMREKSQPAAVQSITFSEIPPPSSIDEALYIIRNVLAGRPDDVVIIIDEFERIASDGERQKLAEFIKNTPTLGARIKFIVCGAAVDLTDLVGHHPSVGRIIEPVELERLTHDDLSAIVLGAAAELKLEVPAEILDRIAEISDGLPSYVHLIGDSLFWNVFDDEAIVKRVSLEHFQAGIQDSLRRAEAALSRLYEVATNRDPELVDSEEVLWALADVSANQRHVEDIYENSYLPVMACRPGRSKLDRETMTNRLRTLKDKAHGAIVDCYGSSQEHWGFSNGVMRGYVRLRAQKNGIAIGCCEREA